MDLLAMHGVELRRDGHRLLNDIDWVVAAGDRWVVLGPNGAGKTTLLQVAATYDAPSRGSLAVLGERFGRTDVRRLRARIGYVSAALADRIRPRTPAFDVVATGRDATLWPWRETYSPAEVDRARTLLVDVGCAAQARRSFGSLSTGEQQRVLLARALMPAPDVLLLDEPAAGMDLAGRELLMAALGRLAQDPAVAGVVFVTHHVEEIPPAFTHALLLRDGAVLHAGPVDEVITSERLSRCFGLGVTVERRAGRYTARAT